MPVTSLNGSRYILVIIDNYSGMYFTYFLNHKDEALKNFILFKEKYENLINKKIKRTRTYNGREFDNTEFSQFLECNGITHEKTIPESCYIAVVYQQNFGRKLLHVEVTSAM